MSTATARSGAAKVRRVVSPAPRDAWAGILDRDPYALPDQAPQWVDALCASGRYVDASRLYRLADGRELVLPLVRRTGAWGAGGWYASYPGSCGIGGLIGEVDAAVVDAVVDDLRGLGAVQVTIRPDPARAAAWAHVDGPGVRVIERCAHLLDLSGGLEGARAGLHKSSRRGLRAAESAGVKVEVDRGGQLLLPVYYELYQHALGQWAKRQHEPARLAAWRGRRRDPLSKLRAMAAALGPDFVVLAATLDGRPIAAEILLLGRNAHDTRAAMDRAVAGPVHAGDLLQWTVIELAAEAGARALHMGESGRSASLAQYKERWGARACRYRELHLERLPVTAVTDAIKGTAKRVVRFRDV